MLKESTSADTFKFSKINDNKCCKYCNTGHVAVGGLSNPKIGSILLQRNNSLVTPPLPDCYSYTSRAISVRIIILCQSTFVNLHLMLKNRLRLSDEKLYNISQ